MLDLLLKMITQIMPHPNAHRHLFALRVNSQRPIAVAHTAAHPVWSAAVSWPTVHYFLPFVSLLIQLRHCTDLHLIAALSPGLQAEQEGAEQPGAEEVEAPAEAKEGAAAAEPEPKAGGQADEPPETALETAESEPEPAEGEGEKNEAAVVAKESAVVAEESADVADEAAAAREGADAGVAEGGKPEGMAAEEVPSPSAGEDEAPIIVEPSEAAGADEKAEALQGEVTEGAEAGAEDQPPEGGAKGGADGGEQSPDAEA